MKTKKLYRSCKDRILGGVAGGIAEYFEIDSTLVRLIFALLIVSGGIGILAYIIGWIIIPEDPACVTTKAGKNGADEIKETAERFANDVRTSVKSNGDNRDNLRFFVGLLITVIGLILLTQVLFGMQLFRILWPTTILAIGILIIINSLRK